MCSPRRLSPNRNLIEAYVCEAGGLRAMRRRKMPIVARALSMAARICGSSPLNLWILEFACSEVHAKNVRARKTRGLRFMRLLPNGSRLSCGRPHAGATDVEREQKQAGDSTLRFP